MPYVSGAEHIAVWDLSAGTTWAVPLCRACTARVAQAWCSPAGRSPTWFSQRRHHALVSTGQLAADCRRRPYEAQLGGPLDGECWIVCTLRPTRPGCQPIRGGCQKKSKSPGRPRSLSRLGLIASLTVFFITPSGLQSTQQRSVLAMIEPVPQPFHDEKANNQRH
jgi:hypothetical protein